ncbi:MAG: PadR family transcriptional regulator [Alphaproteobacteria bacterium]|nr:PadR family transcriptional regulator [Alphaproteobacteria bacterium]
MDVRTLCLGVLSLGERSGYEIRKTVEGALGHFFDAGFGSIYPALNRMAKDGDVTVTAIGQEKRPDKKVYRITQKGRLALAEALIQVPAKDRLRSEFLVVMLFSEILSAGQLGARLDENIRLHRQIAKGLEACKNDCVPWGAQRLTPGMRFVTGYGVAMHKAAADYIEENRHLLEAPAVLAGRNAAD